MENRYGDKRSTCCGEGAEHASSVVWTLHTNKHISVQQILRSNIYLNLLVESAAKIRTLGADLLHLLSVFICDYIQKYVSIIGQLNQAQFWLTEEITHIVLFM